MARWKGADVSAEAAARWWESLAWEKSIPPRCALLPPEFMEMLISFHVPLSPSASKLALAAVASTIQGLLGSPYLPSSLLPLSLFPCLPLFFSSSSTVMRGHSVAWTISDVTAGPNCFSGACWNSWDMPQEERRDGPAFNATLSRRLIAMWKEEIFLHSLSALPPPLLGKAARCRHF